MSALRPSTPGGLRAVVDAEVLARVGGLGARARLIAEGALQGQHRSPHRGASVEFAQHREYVAGDELKHLDWKAYARQDRYVVKQFEDETNLRVFLLVDASNSMNYGAPSKLDFGATVAASLAYVMLRQGDAVGLQVFGQALGEYVPPRGRPDHFWSMVRALEAAPVGGETRIASALEHISEVAGRRAAIYLFSDMLDFDPRTVGLLRELRRRRHRVDVLHVLHPDELSFPFDDLTIFEALESTEEELADPKGMRAQYVEEVTAFCDDLKRRLGEGDVGYRRVLTTDAIDALLLSLIGGRAA